METISFSNFFFNLKELKIKIRYKYLYNIYKFKKVFFFIILFYFKVYFFFLQKSCDP